MFKYKKLEKAVIMLVSDNRSLNFNGYSRIGKSKFDENGNVKEDTEVRLNYDGEVVRIYIDSIFVFAVNNGWIFSYKTFLIKDKNMKVYVKKEIDKIISGYVDQVKQDKEYIIAKFK